MQKTSANKKKIHGVATSSCQFSSPELTHNVLGTTGVPREGEITQVLMCHKPNKPPQIQEILSEVFRAQ